MYKKVLIAIGDVGNGHRSGANALTESFNRLYPNVEVKTVDVFKLSNLWPYKETDELYKTMSKSKYLETINNTVFRITNTKYLYDVFTNYNVTQLYDTTLQLLKEEKPDLVISVHPIVSMVLERMREDMEFLSVVVITDLITLYRGWADKNADLVFSPTTEAVKTLTDFGVNVNRIIYPLFPINPKLKNFREKSEVIDELGFDSKKQTILITAGGAGIKSLSDSIDNLAKREDLQLIIITGKVEDYRIKLTEKYRNNRRIKVFGYINNIQDYLNASDIIVGKPGPATILEIELFDKKAVLTRKIGEQEVGNIDYAIRNPKFRYVGDNGRNLELAVTELLAMSPEKQGNFRRRSFDESNLIVKDIYKLLVNGKEQENTYVEERKVEDFLATTVLISAIGVGVYKIIRKLSKK